MTDYESTSQSAHPHIILGAAAKKRLVEIGGKTYIRVAKDRVIGPVKPDGTIDGECVTVYKRNEAGGIDCDVHLPSLKLVPEAHAPSTGGKSNG